MKLTEQMKFLLFQILSDSLMVTAAPFKLSIESRMELWEKIVKLQDSNTEIKDN